MRNKLTVGVLLTCSLLASAPALAFPAYSTSRLNLRGGPGEEFPVVGIMEKNVTVEVTGCLADWSWCVVNVSGVPGWVSAKYVVVNVQTGVLHIDEVGEQGRVPVVGPDGVVIPQQ